MVLTPWKFEFFFHPNFFDLKLGSIKLSSTKVNLRGTLLAKRLFFIQLSTFAFLFQNKAFFTLESLKSLSRAELSAPPPPAAASAETSEALGGYANINIYKMQCWGCFWASLIRICRQRYRTDPDPSFSS